MTNVSPWIICTLTFPQFNRLFDTMHCHSHLESWCKLGASKPRDMIRSITHKPYYIFLKTTTIPTYYGFSMAIPRHIAMQLPPLLFDYLSIHCHIGLHDHIAIIVVVAEPQTLCQLYDHAKQYDNECSSHQTEAMEVARQYI